MNNKEFNRAKAFTFYAEWSEIADMLEADYGAEVSNEFYKAIKNYALFSIEPVLSAPIKYLWPQLKEKIDASQAHRARGFYREDKELTKLILELREMNPNATQREIAETIGCSIGKVNKVLKNIASTNTTTITSTSTTVDIE